MARLYLQHAKVDGTTVFSTAHQREVDVRVVLSHWHYYIDAVRKSLIAPRMRPFAYEHLMPKQCSLAGVLLLTTDGSRWYHRAFEHSPTKDR
jgi:hypothetical protein